MYHKNFLDLSTNKDSKTVLHVVTPILQMLEEEWINYSTGSVSDMMKILYKALVCQNKSAEVYYCPCIHLISCSVSLQEF